jgi:glycosyltransferase involved in cell wall biosynthesis
MPDPVPLSVVILAKNEAGRLRECIESVRWAAEVLVVDDESTDDTVPLAESLGARVVRRKMDIEGRHRNWAHAQAAHEWILSLDADERVTPELAAEIARQFLAGPSHELYSIPRRNYIGARWLRYGGWYPSAQLKLFKRSIFRWEETTVHPRAFSDSPVGTLAGDLIHLTYRDIRDFVDKMNRQTTLEAQKWVADRRRMSLGKAVWRSVDRFFRAYIGKRGYRDGYLGYVMAVMGGMYQFVSYAKYWEHSLSEGAQPSADGPRAPAGSLHA